MVKYLFKLKKAYVPDLTQRTDKDDLYSGVRLVYVIKKVYFHKVFKWDVTYFIVKLGTETFLNPFKKYWPKKDYFLPHAYWGKPKHPLTRLWVTIDPRINPLGTDKIIPKASLQRQKVKILKRPFRSKMIADHLFKKDSKFYIYKQSN